MCITPGVIREPVAAYGERRAVRILRSRQRQRRAYRRRLGEFQLDLRSREGRCVVVAVCESYIDTDDSE